MWGWQPSDSLLITAIREWAAPRWACNHPTGSQSDTEISLSSLRLHISSSLTVIEQKLHVKVDTDGCQNRGGKTEQTPLTWVRVAAVSTPTFFLTSWFYFEIFRSSCSWRLFSKWQPSSNSWGRETCSSSKAQKIVWLRLTKTICPVDYIF